MSTSEHDGTIDFARHRVVVAGDGPLARTIRMQYDHTRAFAGAETRNDIVVIDEGNDPSTIGRLAALIGNGAPLDGRPTAVIARIANPMLSQAIETRVEADGIVPRPILINDADLIAEHFVTARPLFPIALWRDQPRLHVALVGFGTLAPSFIEAVVLDGIAEGLAPPAISIIAADRDATEAALRHAMPEIAASAEIVVAPLHPADLGDPRHSPLIEAEARSPLTAILVLCDDPAATMQASARICDLQDRHGLATAALFIGGPGAAQAAALTTPRRPPHNLGRQIAPIPDLDAVPELLAHILSGRDKLARRIHEAYQSQYGAQTGAGVAWNDLAETYKRANRRAARHLTQKLWSLGIAPSRETRNAVVDQSTYDHVIVPLVRATVEDDTIRSLARLEHERWCADRRLDGWRFGEPRDDTQRLHPSLVPFDDPRLTADEIGKDIAQLRFLLGSAVRVERDGACTRFIIGIVDRPDNAQAGVGLAAARERLRQQPHRGAILLSPLLTAREVEDTATLMNDLGARPAIHLIVPEWCADNRTLRDNHLAGSQRLKDLLGDPRTLIAPIGPRGACVSPGWEDLSGSSTAHDAVIAYVTARADVLVTPH